MLQTDGSLKSANAPTQGQPKSSFDSLADQFSCSLRELKERVLDLNGVFKTVLRPEAPACDNEKCQEPAVRSNLEVWLSEQFAIVRNCNDRLSEYKDRCCL